MTKKSFFSVGSSSKDKPRKGGSSFWGGPSPEPSPKPQNQEKKPSKDIFFAQTSDPPDSHYYAKGLVPPFKDERHMLPAEGGENFEPVDIETRRKYVREFVEARDVWAEERTSDIHGSVEKLSHNRFHKHTLAGLEQVVASAKRTVALTKLYDAFFIFKKWVKYEDERDYRKSRLSAINSWDGTNKDCAINTHGKSISWVERETKNYINKHERQNVIDQKNEEKEAKKRKALLKKEQEKEERELQAKRAQEAREAEKKKKAKIKELERHIRQAEKSEAEIRKSGSRGSLFGSSDFYKEQLYNLEKYGDTKRPITPNKKIVGQVVDLYFLIEGRPNADLFHGIMEVEK